ncbi:4-amino-4-deoxy-L-arabinose transferase [Pseudomonas sp. ok272]|uniref:glycosyltransferase family 39 protein n=1 Tax=unclassified Pseudomonas TaxID=196821 RepID=UPI0008BEC8B8|nr:MULTISPECIES: glycosyltransferase family 39 protein [unclassified Pseudomonas]SEN23310.1 4-amino-4-deoxy-L-arabinose transferase [Pseudomonas sp. ok272]SFN14543.1 4-amino-4-deoxy-L-arabinose transferase [Pseudomonas sp. ok602]
MSPSSSTRIAQHSLALGVLALLLFCAGVYQQTAIGFDTRFVLFAEEMLRHGPGFFPTTYGQPYADYWATSTVFTWLLSLPFGQVNALTAWLPSALASAVIVTLMYRLVAPYSRTWALISIALLLLSNTFITETRAVSLDQMVAAVTFSVFYLGYAADHFQAPRRLPLILALLVLGFAIRGPIGLVVPTGVLCSYYLLTGQWRRMIVFGVLAAVLLAAGIGLLLWLAKVSGGETFVQDVIRMQFMGRLDGREGASDTLYYFTSSMGNYALAYPLAVLVLAVVLLVGRKDRGPALRLLALCTAAGLIIMIGLSIPMAKKARYMLPMLPMAAIIAAYPFQGAQGRALQGLRVLMQALWLLLPGLLIVGLVVAKRRFPEYLGSVTAVMVVLGVLQVIALGMLFKPRVRAVGLAFSAVLGVWSAYILVFEPVQHALYDTRTFSRAAFALIQKDPAPVVLHAMGKDAKAIKFMVNLDQDLQPQFTHSLQDLQALAGPVWLIMDDSQFQALKSSPLGTLQPALVGNFDKDRYVLLRLP